MWRQFTEQAKRALFAAQVEAERRGENRVQPEHLLLGVLADANSGASRLLIEMGVSPAELVKQTELLLVPGPGRNETPLRLDTRSALVLEMAQQESERFSAKFIGPEHLLLGLISAGVGAAGAVFRAHGPDIESARRALHRAPEAAAEQAARAGVPPSPPRVRSASVAVAVRSRETKPPVPLGWTVTRWAFALTFLFIAFLILIALLGA